MKCVLILFVTLAVMMCLVQAQPVGEEKSRLRPLIQVREDYPGSQVKKDKDESVETHSRQKRATCDLLSKFNVNHSACAAHCLVRGNRGGYCNNKAVCICRK
ncbi:defensin-like [Drosophila tropicalis]|uniref:defensin-like n=1 Tax=Drosophila tropicalis TaxID=46794 RepID=UPI0035AB6BE2